MMWIRSAAALSLLCSFGVLAAHARPLTRVIQQALQDGLAELILAGQIGDGETVPVTVEAGSLLIGGRLSGKERRPADAPLN